MSQLNAHAKAVSEILFHQDRPDNLFTCSISGELWHWNNAQSSKLKLGELLLILMRYYINKELILT